MYYYLVRKSLKTGEEWIDYESRSNSLESAEREAEMAKNILPFLSKLNPVVRISKCDLYEFEIVKIIKEGA